VLVCRKSTPWAFHVSTFLLAAVFALTYAIVQGVRQQPSGGLVVLAVVDLLLAVLAVLHVNWLGVDGRFLRVRHVLGTDRLTRFASAFGVRAEAGAKSIAYVVFVTDGFRHVDLAFYASDSSARRAVRRLTAALLDGAPSPTSPGSREVERVEAQFRASSEAAERIVAEYYESRTWKRARLLILVFGAISMAAALLSWFYAQRTQIGR